jgi:L-ribulose-5-phosphate 4-epimerase
MLYPELRAEVCAMNKELPAQGLVVWTGGNVSGIVRDAGHIVIKPSGLSFDELTPENLVVTDMEGNVVEGELKPSVDLGIHRYIYKRRLDIGGICHTHAPFSTSFALLGEDLPMALTPIAHLLGHNVCCTRYAQAGYEDTGEAIMEVLGDNHAAVLVKQHGPFTFGKTPTASVKVATYLEEAAKTIHFAVLRGKVEPLPDDEIERCYNFYHTSYGQ